MGMESKFIWLNGEMLPFEKATLHFLTAALHYGAAVFEGIRAYDTPKGPAVFRLTDHAERLLRRACSVSANCHGRPSRLWRQSSRQ